jgi:hypothetical protein
MVTPIAFFDMLETFGQPGCTICNLLVRTVDQYLDSLLYEYANTRESHRTFRDRRGMCNEHGWQLLQHKGSSLGIAILYKAAVDEMLKMVDQTPGVSRLWNSKSPGASVAERLDPVGQCPACTILTDSEKSYVQVFCDHLTDERLQNAYRGSAGLCLPHFQQTLRQARTRDQLQLLIDIQSNIWRKLKAELNEFIDKTDYSRAQEAMGAEGDSWQRAVGQTCGQRGLFGLDARLR